MICTATTEPEPVFNQMEMPYGVFHVPEPQPGETLDEQFMRFHRANPWVFTKLRDMALELKKKGHSKIGIKMLFEVLRWQYYRQTTDTASFKLNNNYTSRYARLLMQEVPELKGGFETRTLQT